MVHNMQRKAVKIMAKRRPQGDGMVRKRSDGRWEARIVIGHKNDGTPMHKSVFGKTHSTNSIARLKPTVMSISVRTVA